VVTGALNANSNRVCNFGAEGYSSSALAKSNAGTYHPRRNSERRKALTDGAFFSTSFFNGESGWGHFGGPLSLSAVVITPSRLATLFITQCRELFVNSEDRAYASPQRACRSDSNAHHPNRTHRPLVLDSCCTQRESHLGASIQSDLLGLCNREVSA
jgi:hypothetical protein